MKHTENRGSEWRKWDLHVHTKLTNKNDQFKSKDINSFFELFFKKACELNIEAIGITDYFSIDRYKDALNYVANIDNKVDELGVKIFTDNEIEFIRKIFLFPNVELRMLPTTHKGKLLNIHCLFNPTYVSSLDNDFFNHIENESHKKMNRQGIIDYGYSLNETLGDNNLAYKKGVNSYAITLDSIKDLLEKNEDFRSNVIIVVSNSSSDGASGFQKHYDNFENENGSLDGVRKSIYRVSDCIFSTNKEDIKFFLGKRGGKDNDQSVVQNKIDKVITSVGSLKPCIVGSDAHSEEDLFTRFTWIKSDLSFEGLKQIIYEPEQRVKIQLSKPDVKDDKEVISYVQFKSDNKKFNTAPIYLNPNLNVIIGGKSSGKSILLYSIAKTLSSDNNVLNKDDGSEKYKLESIDGTFDFTVVSQGGIAQSMYGNEQLSIIPNIKYIPQNYLVKLAEPELNKKGKSLNKIVRDLIKEDGIAENKYSSFISTLKGYDEKREVLINRYFALSDELVDLNVKIKNAGNPEVLKQNIQKNTKKVEQLNKESGITEEQQALYKELQGKQEAIAKKSEFLGVDYNNVCEFFTRIEGLVEGVIEAKLSLEGKFKDEVVRSEYQKKLSYIDEFGKLTQTLKEEIRTELKADNKTYFIHDNIFRSRYKEIQEEEREINKAFMPFHRGQELQKQVKLINDVLAVDKKFLGELNNLINQRKIKEKEIKQLKNKLFELYGSTLEEYIDIIKNLEYRTTELKSESLKIQGVTKFNFAKFQNVLLQISNKRYDIENQYSYLLDSRKNELSDYNSDELIEEMKVLFDDIVSDNYKLNKGIHKKEAIKKLLDDYFYDYWQVSYKNDKLGNMSTGKASFVILMLIIGLSKSKSPILIDQPEDNLDNRSITKDLIGYLRAKKLERQIILVTHNANIVVNSDAENIIVANQRGQDNTDSESEYLFDYVNGPIENTFPYNEEEKNTLKSMGIREHIAEIVEGGKEAFKLRELKYQF